jgi:predicted nucleotidyltransferase
MIESGHEARRSHCETAGSDRGLEGQGGDVAVLYGSTSRDESNATSDLDLFLDYDPRGSFNGLDLVAAGDMMRDRLGVKIDLTTRNGLHPLIRKKIETEATRIF